MFDNEYGLSSNTVAVRMWPLFEGEGDIERLVYDKWWLMLMFIVRFEVHRPGLVLNLGV